MCPTCRGDHARVVRQGLVRLLLLLFGVQSVRLVPLGLLLRPLLLVVILARLLFVVGGVAQLRTDVVAKLNGGASSTAAEAEQRAAEAE